MSEAKSIDLFVQKQLELRAEVAKVIIGQEEVVELLVNALFSKGHALLVGVPGLA